MVRTRLVPSVAFTLAAVSACGAEPPPPPVMPPPVVEVAKPAATHARWVFPTGRRRVAAKLDLGGGATLYVGADGLRRVAKGAEPPVDATTVALHDFLGVLKNRKGDLLFVTVDGDVLLGHEPLGPLEASQAGPLDVNPERFAWVTTGRDAILGLTQDGRLLRSGDYGASWHEVAYAGAAKGYGHPASVELDGSGNGLLLHFPQRVFVTHDDGATWTHLPSPGIGASEIHRDGADRLWLVGRSERARLEGPSLKVTTDAMLPLVAPPPAPAADDHAKDPNTRRNARSFLSGDRSVELAEIYRHGKVREVEVRSAPLGDKPGNPVTHAMLVGPSGLSRHVAGHGAELVYLREDDDVDPSAPTTTVLRSADYGATWREETKLKGVDVQERTGVDVAVGPDGWTFVTALCPHYSPEGRSCAHRQIRPAGATAFQDMQFDEELTPVSFAFDRERDRVYALGIHNGRKHVYVSPLSQNRFTRTNLLDVQSYTHATLTVDAQGAVRALAYDGSKRAWTLHRRPVGGDELPVLYVPLGNGAVAFTGPRGLLLGAHEAGWETADAGDTWTRTPGVSASSVACTEKGCLDDDGTERVGWDLEVASPQGADHDGLVTASPEPPKLDGKRPEPPRVAVTPIDAVCKPTGAATTVASIPGSEMVDGLVADVRWAMVKRDQDGKTSIVFGNKNQVRDTQLLPAAPKAKAVVTGKTTTTIVAGDRVLADGVVAARYRLTKDAEGHSQPIEVELTWWAAATGRTHYQTLHKVPPFYVSSWGFSGTPQIVDGGLLFQPTWGREVYFVRDDGKVETFAIPSGANVRNAERIGKGWLLAEGSSGNMQLFWSNDGAKEWSRRDWRLDTSGSALMALVDGKATVSFSRGSFPSALYLLGPSPANDPPLPVVIDAGTIDGPCDAHAATLRAASYIPSDERRLRARVEVAKDGLPAGRLSVGQRVTHSTGTGTICTSAYILTGTGTDPKTYDSQTAFLYPDGKNWSGWWFHHAPDPKDATKKVVLAAPLACEPGPPEAKR